MKLPRSFPTAALLFLLLSGFCLPASALRYKPKEDETLSHVSLIHYGASKKFIYITKTNGIEDPNRIPKGTRLRIPTVWRYRLRRGDDLAKVAKKYLKDSDRADFLMWLNRIKDPRKLEKGQLITIPFLIRHKVAKGENMIKVARKYYWTTRPTGLLRKFNAKRSNSLKPGEIVYVPIYDPQAATEKVKERLHRHQEKEKKAEEEARRRALAAAAKSKDQVPAITAPGLEDILGSKKDGGEADGEKASPDGGVADGGTEVAKSPAPTTARQVQEATALYRDGEYEQARAILAMALEGGGLSKADEAEAREVMAFCLVALDRPDEAEHEFVRLLMVVPDRKLDPITTSPKILKVFEKAKGK